CEQPSSNPRDPINPLGLAVYKKVEGHFAAFGTSKWLKLSGQLSSLFFALGGPLAERATAFIDTGLVWGAAALPDRFAISFMRANLAATSPGQQLAAVEFTGSRQAVARSLATAIADMSGGRVSLYRSGGRQVYDQQAEKVVSGKALIVEDEAEFKRLQMMSGRTPSAQRAATIATHVQVHAFERLYAASVRRFSSLEVKGGVIGALFAAASGSTAYGELAKAEAEANKKVGSASAAKKVKIAYWQVRSGMAALVGGLAETAAAMARHFSWGIKPIPLLGNVTFFKSYSQALSTVGRLLGGVGGIIAGVLTVIEGQEEFQTNSRIGISLMALGLIVSASSFVVLLTAFGVVAHLGPAGIIVGILAALAVIAIQLFKDDDIEKWLKRTLYFGLEGVESFGDFTEQTEALTALMEAQYYGWNQLECSR